MTQSRLGNKCLKCKTEEYNIIYKEQRKFYVIVLHKFIKACFFELDSKVVENYSNFFLKK